MSQVSRSRAFISDKPYPVPIEMRPLWRISLIVIAIQAVSREKQYLDIRKVNILVWMLIRREKWAEYVEYLYDRSRDVPLVSVDTATYRAVELAVGKEFVAIDNGRLYLLPAGQELYSIILDHELMSDELEFLSEYGRKLTEFKVRGLMGKSK